MTAKYLAQFTTAWRKTRQLQPHFSGVLALRQYCKQRSRCPPHRKLQQGAPRVRRRHANHARWPGRGGTCSINNEQPRSKTFFETRGLHEPDVGQPGNDIYNERGQAGSLETQNDAYIVGSKRNADDGDEECEGANDL